MNCSFHPQNAATAYCRTCGRALCPQCQRQVMGAIYCESCIAERLGEAAPPPPPPGAPGVPPAAPGRGPSPGLAAFLGFIPGVGALYNGQFGKAFAHLLVFIGLCWAANSAGDIGWVFGWMIAFWIFYMVVDAYRVAHARELGQSPPRDPFGFDQWWVSDRAREAQASGVANATGSPAPASSVAPAAPAPAAATPAGAIALIALGVVFLLTNSGLMPWWGVHEFWPLMLIALGVWLFFRRRQCAGCQCQRCQTRGLMGPAVLVTLGALFLLNELRGPGHVAFHKTFPVLFIVMGAVLIIGRTASGEGHYEPPPPPPPAVTPPLPSSGESEMQSNTEVHNG